MKAQEETYQYYIRRKTMEQADRDLAQKLLNAEKEVSCMCFKSFFFKIFDLFSLFFTLHFTKFLVLNQVQPQRNPIEEMEERDRILAEQLSKQEVMNQPKIAVPLRDAELALEIYKKEQEERKRILSEKEKIDEAIAAELQKQYEEEQKKEEFEETLRIIKQQAKAESDAQIAKLLKEKEELAAQLQQSFDSNFGDAVGMKGVEFPDYWQNQVAGFQTFDLHKNSDEFKRIESLFHQTLPNSQIKRIVRNQ